MLGMLYGRYGILNIKLSEPLANEKYFILIVKSDN